MFKLVIAGGTTSVVLGFPVPLSCGGGASKGRLMNNSGSFPRQTSSTTEHFFLLSKKSPMQSSSLLMKGIFGLKVNTLQKLTHLLIFSANLFYRR